MEFIDVKGWKLLGNKFEDVKVIIFKCQFKVKKVNKVKVVKKEKGKLSVGDSVEFDLEDNGQMKMF